MINTGKKDIVVSYLAYFLRLTANIILLPIILSQLSTDEYGAWNIFISIGAIVNLVDVGFGSVLTRYSTYAFCGARSIGEKGLPEMGEESNTNYELLNKVFYVAKRIYSKLFAITIIISVVLTGYILFKTVQLLDTVYVVSAWLIYAASCCMQIYYVSYNCIIKGMGNIKESSGYFIIQQVVHIALAFILLRLGFGLIGLATSHFVSTLVFRVLNSRFLKKKLSLSKDILLEMKADISTEYEAVYAAVKKNTKEIALVTVSNYFSNYGMTLICSMFLPLSAIASIGITNQLIGVVGGIANGVFSSYISKMGDMLINGKLKKLRSLFSKLNVWFILAYVVGTVAVVFVGPIALRIIQSDTQLLNTPIILLMALSSFLINNHQRCTNFIMLSNRQPHVKAYFITTLAVLIASFACMLLSHSVLGYIIPNLVIQAFYNGWKWPLEAYKKLGYKKQV